MNGCERMPGVFDMRTGEMLFLFSLRFTPKNPAGAEEGGNRRAPLDFFSSLSYFCLSVAFETDDERESTYGAERPHM